MGDSLSDIWKLKSRGKRDSDRHKELVKKAIKKNGKDIITEYNIISSKGNKKVKIPIKFLDQYKFKYGKLKKKSGVAQGMSGKPGDKYKIGQPQQGQGAGGQAGNDQGEIIFDAEMTIDEVVDLLLEDMNLPWLEPKKTSAIEVESEELSSLEKKGIMPNLDLKRTLVENIKRNAARGKAEIGNFKKEDMRYRTWDTDKVYHSKAVIYLMMDRSGSMDEEKTKIAKTFYFWMVQFLRKKYKTIDIFFIAHDTHAYMVNEDEFFTINASGGTNCSSAYQMAYDHIVANNFSESSSVYVFECSDGDNWLDDSKKCIEIVKKTIPLVTAMGYGEILTDVDRGWIKEEYLLSNLFAKEIKRTRFVPIQFRSADDIFDGLKAFFNIDGKEDVQAIE